MSDEYEGVEGTNQREKLARLRQSLIIQGAEAGTLDLMSFDFPPHDPEEREILGRCVSIELLRILRARLSPPELGLVTSLNTNAEVSAPFSPEEAQLYNKLDEVLIEQTSALGWRIHLSSLMMARFACWCDNDVEGIEKLGKFTAALNCHAKVKRGKAQLPLTEQEWPQTRKNALREIKVLQRRLSAQVAAGKRYLAVEQAAGLIHSEITAQPLAYRFLCSNLLSFSDYLEKHSLPLVFVTRQISPGTVLNGWFDYQGSTPEDKSRQIISRLASQKRQ
jgi:hypothetical protein